MSQADKSLGGSAISEREVALIRAHRANIQRFKSLLEISLSDEDRAFVERRLAEEQAVIEQITGAAAPALSPQATEFGIPILSTGGDRADQTSAVNGHRPGDNSGL
jgi:hypothetical protein